MTALLFPMIPLAEPLTIFTDPLIVLERPLVGIVVHQQGTGVSILYETAKNASEASPSKNFMNV